ncbi:hypothetical protein Tco_0407236, partial [Tanacetum coccineum]
MIHSWLSSWLNTIYINLNESDDIITSISKLEFIPLVDGTYTSLSEGVIWLSIDKTAFRGFENVYSNLRIVDNELLNSSVSFSENVTQMLVKLGDGNLIDMGKLVSGSDMKWYEVDVGYLDHPVAKESPDGEMKLRKFLEKLGVTDFVKIVKKVYERRENVRKCKTLDYDSQELKRLLSIVSLNGDREKGRYFLEVNNVRLANYIGLKSTVTLDDALSVLELWRKSENFKASISEMSKFYTYIWNEMSISKQKIVGNLHSQAFIFVPYSFGSKLEVVSGLFLSPNEVYWHDSTGLMKQTKSTVAHSPVSKMLCKIYPDLHDFFVDEFGVDDNPSPNCYLQFLRHLSTGSSPSLEAKT